MPRTARHAPGGIVYHALNRGVARQTLFHKDADYDAFERVMAEGLRQHPTRLLAHCLMPNHWHMVLWPRADDELTRFLRWVTHVHTQRYHSHYHTSGTGHLYQGRFKSFPVQSDPHLLIVLRYVERNAPRAALVQRAEDWRWGSLWRRRHGQAAEWLSDGPLPLPDDWLAFVNEPQTQAELDVIRQSTLRGCPFGDDVWQLGIAKTLRLQSTLRPHGRPKKQEDCAQETNA